MPSVAAHIADCQLRPQPPGVTARCWQASLRTTQSAYASTVGRPTTGAGAAGSPGTAVSSNAPVAAATTAASAALAGRRIAYSV